MHRKSTFVKSKTQLQGSQLRIASIESQILRGFYLRIDRSGRLAWEYGCLRWQSGSMSHEVVWGTESCFAFNEPDLLPQEVIPAISHKLDKRDAANICLYDTYP